MQVISRTERPHAALLRRESQSSWITSTRTAPTALPPRPHLQTARRPTPRQRKSRPPQRSPHRLPTRQRLIRPRLNRPRSIRRYRSTPRPLGPTTHRARRIPTEVRHPATRRSAGVAHAAVSVVAAQADPDGAASDLDPDRNESDLDDSDLNDAELAKSTARPTTSPIRQRTIRHRRTRRRTTSNFPSRCARDVHRSRLPSGRSCDDRRSATPCRSRRRRHQVRRFARPNLPALRRWTLDGSEAPAQARRGRFRRRIDRWWQRSGYRTP